MILLDVSNQRFLCRKFFFTTEKKSYTYVILYVKISTGQLDNRYIETWDASYTFV
jgi:hypothetical protein